MRIPHDPVALEEHFKDDDNGPVSNQGYMPYLTKFILDKVLQHACCSGCCRHGAAGLPLSLSDDVITGRRAVIVFPLWFVDVWNSSATTPP